MTNLILCGGAGTRLWPLSRKATPKQFVDLLGGPTLFERTVSRNAPLVDSYFIITGQAHLALVEEQFASANGVRGPGLGTIILEPVGRNTAPAIAMACLSLPGDEVILVSPSDHEIRDEAAYQTAVRAAIAAAQAGWLCTFGLEPAYPETGYGYVEAGPGLPYRKVQAFKEKPDRPTAESYLAAGNYYWNSGMFCFTAGAFLSELERQRPAMLAACRAALEAARATNPAPVAPSAPPPRSAPTQAPAAPAVPPTRPILSIPLAAMEAIPADSIDYAVMEGAAKVAVVPCDIGWNDLGSWDAILEVRDRDQGGNALGPEVLALDTNSSLAIGSGKRLVLIGVEDLLVVDTPDALLITRRGRSQDVKKAVDSLKTGDQEDRALL